MIEAMVRCEAISQNQERNRNASFSSSSSPPVTRQRGSTASSDGSETSGDSLFTEDIDGKEVLGNGCPPSSRSSPRSSRSSHSSSDGSTETDGTRSYASSSVFTSAPDYELRSRKFELTQMAQILLPKWAYLTVGILYFVCQLGVLIEYVQLFAVSFASNMGSHMSFLLTLGPGETVDTVCANPVSVTPDQRVP